MSGQSDYGEVMQVIKQTMRQRKITYSILAQQLGMSESSIKKQFIGKDNSFGRISQICEVLQLRLVDILAALDSKSETEFRFSSKQQEFFLENIECFNFYWKLVYERMPVDDIEKKLRLSKSEIFRLLRQLDQLKLIELHAENRIKLPNVRAVRWSTSGPFMQFIRDQWSKETIRDAVAQDQSGKSHFTLQYFQLSKEGFQKLLESLRRLESEFAKQTARELALGNKPEICARFVAAVARGSHVRNQE